MKSIILSFFTLLILCTLSTIAFSASPQAPVPQTGQATSYDATYNSDDGALKKGIPWPTPRFVVSNGTVTDNLTGLIWLVNGNCTDTVGGVAKTPGTLGWANALTWSSNLAAPACGLSDGSVAGNWRLPNIRELRSLVNISQADAATWLNAQGFSTVMPQLYWTSNTNASTTGQAWSIDFTTGRMDSSGSSNAKTFNNYVLPVRGGL